MIISASRRTDIPAFYAPWFMQRIRAGEVAVRNPFNARQVRRISLTPDSVQAIVFWTRNPLPLMAGLQELDAAGYRYYFQFTLTGYGPPLERASPAVPQALAAFARLSERLGPERIVWRYDPLLLSSRLSEQEQLARFAALAKQLQGLTDSVVISLLDPYARAARRLAGLPEGDRPWKPEVGDPALGALVRQLLAIAERRGMRVQSCAEPELGRWGVEPGSCIDAQRLQALGAGPLRARKDAGQRQGCTCIPSVDIGAYNTCLHGCVYCYATSSDRAAAANRRRHQPDEPFLLPLRSS